MAFITKSGKYQIHTIGAVVSRCYLIESEDGLLLVDSGTHGNEKRIVARIEGISQKPLRLIFITHAHLDHYGSAKGIKEKTGAPIMVHEEDAESMIEGRSRITMGRGWGKIAKILLPLWELVYPTTKTPPDFYVSHGYTFGKYGFEARVVHTPGHTRGSCCLLLEEKYLFAGDMVISRPHVYAQKYFADDWCVLEKSLEFIKGIGPEFVFPGHGEPFDGCWLKGIHSK